NGIVYCILVREGHQGHPPTPKASDACAKASASEHGRGKDIWIKFAILRLEKNQLQMKNGQSYSKEEMNPLANIEQWDEDVLNRYPEPGQPSKTKEEFRNYENPVRDTVREFYRLNHKYQTYDFVERKRNEFLQFNRKEMPVWNAMEFLNTLVDDSDPDIDLDQLQHLLQTAEAIRHDGHPDWFVLTGFIHDMGKVLCLF